MAELKWYDIEMTSNTTPAPYRASASSEIVDTQNRLYPAWKAFDGKDEILNEFNAWASVSGNVVGAWLQFDFGENKNVSALRFTARSDSAGVTQTPTAFKIEGSVNSLDWFVIAEVKKLSWGPNEKLTVEFPATQYRFYKLTHSSSNSTLVAWAKVEFGYRYTKKFIVGSPTTNQHYSLESKTLITLPNISSENIASYGVGVEKEIQLDTPFNKFHYVTEGSKDEDATKFVQSFVAPPIKVWLKDVK